PGRMPGGMALGLVMLLKDSSVGPGGKMPPSTAGKMPAATGWWCRDTPPDLPVTYRKLRIFVDLRGSLIGLHFHYELGPA
ncbi:MAG: hypothetical protein NT154_42365, partial [Verrucomicrobia bacterium]|nr:hypothetical protein [Verrucomicrobiota bacterium]